MRIKNAPLVQNDMHQGGIFMKPADQNRLICGRNKLFPYFLQARARGGRIVPEVKQGGIEHVFIPVRILRFCVLFSE